MVIVESDAVLLNRLREAGAGESVGADPLTRIELCIQAINLASDHS